MLFEYCNKWKLIVNTSKTKIMIFRKGGQLPANTRFHYGDTILEIVSKFVYLGILFTTRRSFSGAQNTLAGQGLKALFKMNKYLRKFTNISVKHKLELFDKLVLHILNYGCEVWGFHLGNAIERLHLQFCKRLLGVKNSTQNDFVYGELRRLPLPNIRYYNIINFGLKYCISIIKNMSKGYIMHCIRKH